MVRRSVILLWLLLIGCEDALRLSHVQARGTEFSHFTATPSEDVALSASDYIRHTLTDQLGLDGVRQVDVGVTYDPIHGQLRARITAEVTDGLTQCDRFVDCLHAIADWSIMHRQHHALLVVIRPSLSGGPWPEDQHLPHVLPLVEDSIIEAFQRWQIITPGEVTAGYPDLRTALAERGWPAIELSRGRTMFVLNDRGRTRDAYLAGRFLDPDEPRLLFTVADSPEVPYAGIFSFPDVTAANQAQIRALVEQGYLVRAITNTEDAVQRAIDNGVHFLSTRYPDDLLPPDRLGGFPSGCNPVTTDETCEPSMIELPPR